MSGGRRILISTSSFGEWDDSPLRLLKDKGLVVNLNPLGRKLTQDEVVELASGMSGIIAGTEPLNADVLNRLDNLEVISRCGVGMDNVDIEEAHKLGIKVFNTPTGPTLAVAELTVALVFNLLRKVSQMDRELHQNVWKKRMGLLLRGKTLGIIGFGRIGRKVAELFSSLGATICFCDPAVEGDLDGFTKKNLAAILEDSNIVCLHLSLLEKRSSPFLGMEELMQMKKGAFLINCSRGGLVDEQALYEMLEKDHLGGAAVDVFEKEPYDGPLMKLDNVILTPHIGSYAKEARMEMEMQAVKNLLEGIKG